MRPPAQQNQAATNQAATNQTAPNHPPIQHPIRLDSIETAIAAISAGRAVVVVDDADRENEGDIVFAADAATLLAEGR